MTEVLEQESASDSEASCFDLSYSSSKFESDNDGNNDRLDGGIQPYLYEPMKDTTSSGNNENDRPEEENLERLSNLSWYVSLYFIFLLKIFDRCSCR